VCVPKKKLIKISPNFLLKISQISPQKKPSQKFPTMYAPKKFSKLFPMAIAPAPRFFPLPVGRTRPGPRLDDDRGLASRHRCRTFALFVLRAFAASYVAQNLAIHAQIVFIILPTLSPESDIRFYSEGFGARKLLIRFHRQDFRQIKFQGFSGFSLLATTKELQVFLFPSLLDTG
jgi:hypothetical protein